MFYAIINNAGRLLEVTNNDNPAALAAYFKNGERGCFRKVVDAETFARYSRGEEINYAFSRNFVGEVFNFAEVA